MGGMEILRGKFQLTHFRNEETAQRVAFLLTRGVQEADEGKSEAPTPLHQS